MYVNSAGEELVRMRRQRFGEIKNHHRVVFLRRWLRMGWDQ
jgi:hypothetical protein